jgi:hypothetical protein
MTGSVKLLCSVGLAGECPERAEQVDMAALAARKARRAAARRLRAIFTKCRGSLVHDVSIFEGSR